MVGRSCNSMMLAITFLICIVLASVTAKNFRGSRMLLEEEIREERKQKKRDHWKLTQLMDYGEKVYMICNIG